MKFLRYTRLIDRAGFAPFTLEERNFIEEPIERMVEVARGKRYGRVEAANLPRLFPSTFEIMQLFLREPPIPVVLASGKIGSILSDLE